MSMKKLKILGLVLAFALCFPLHSLYKMFPNFISSIFLPVNESIWEHMKILFGSIMISSVVQKLIVIWKKLDYKNICFSNFIGAISSIPIFLVMFLPVYAIIGENMVVTIIIMFIALAISEYIAYRVMKMDDFNLENFTILFVVGVYVIFGLLTYFPLEFELFRDPKTLEYGINK